MLEFNFSYNLSFEIKELINKFYKSLDFVTIEQYVEWPKVINDDNIYCYFFAQENNNICCFAQIIENKKRLFFSKAHINFGPIFTDPVILIEAISEIHNYYKLKNFMQLTIQIGMPIGNITEFVELKLYQKYKFFNYYNNNNWTSIRIDLLNNENIIFNNISKGHKSDIKKAIKLGIQISKEELSIESIIDFSQIYQNMCKIKNIYVHNNIEQIFQNIYFFLRDSNMGKFYIVKNKDNILLGGIIIVYQGNTARYFKGATNMKYNDIPILHLALWEAIKDSKITGYRYFDFWGYNHFISYGANKFKKGFGGEFVFYPQIMHFNFKSITLYIYKYLLIIKSFVKFLLKKN